MSKHERSLDSRAGRSSAASSRTPIVRGGLLVKKKAKSAKKSVTEAAEKVEEAAEDAMGK